MTSAAFRSWALRRRLALNSRARWRKSPALGLWAEGSPGKPVVKVSGWGLPNSTGYLRRALPMYMAAVARWAADSVLFFLPPLLFLPPGLVFLGATLAPKLKDVSNRLLAMRSPRNRRGPLHHTGVVCPAADNSRRV